MPLSLLAADKIIDCGTLSFGQSQYPSFNGNFNWFYPQYYDVELKFSVEEECYLEGMIEAFDENATEVVNIYSSYLTYGPSDRYYQLTDSWIIETQTGYSYAGCPKIMLIPGDYKINVRLKSLFYSSFHYYFYVYK